MRGASRWQMLRRAQGVTFGLGTAQSGGGARREVHKTLPEHFDTYVTATCGAMLQCDDEVRPTGSQVLSKQAEGSLRPNMKQG